MPSIHGLSGDVHQHMIVAIVTNMLTEVIFGALTDAAIGYAGSKGKTWLQDGAAKKELATIVANAIEAAIPGAPALAEDLRSESFAKGVVVPALEALVADPSQLPDPGQHADQFLNMFVARFADGESLDDTLTRVFHTERTELQSAFEKLFSGLRSQLHRSKYWRDLPTPGLFEAILHNTSVTRSAVENMLTAQAVAAVDIERARDDARSGSDELRSWPRAIAGLELARPELQRLKDHVRAKARAATLLIGEAGSGKSALLAKLTECLENESVTVFGIKADALPADVAGFDDIARALGMAGPFLPELGALARHAPVVLIIDQLDAVSDVMDRSSQRMKVLLRLVRHTRDQDLPVHVVVSSRPFEAAHDARFQQLRAEEFQLSLPPIEAIRDLLEGLAIEWAQVPEALWQTLRRPFALKLFVDLVQRGVAPASVDSGSLLDRWLATAQLGADAQRQEVLRLMARLAGEMLDTETLWRPVNAFEAMHKDALARAEACGLIVRSGQKIGFSHQSWLDDFQAKRFKTGSDLAEYAWRNQDSLFMRATLLRSLERLRNTDAVAYQKAVSRLLWSAQTRRHVKHLTLDVVSTAIEPSKQEAAWIETLIQADPILANRALGKIIERWPAWRPLLRKCLPVLMNSAQFHWGAALALAREAQHDPDHVVVLIRRHWHEPTYDHLVFRVAEQSGVITPAVETLISEILNRTAIEHYAVSHFVTTLRVEQRHVEACRLVQLWFSCQPVGRNQNATLHEVSKLAQEAPREFAHALLPVFVSIAQREIQPQSDDYLRFPRASNLPWDWGVDRNQDNVLEAFCDAMNELAATQPQQVLTLIHELEQVEIDEVQEVVARALASGGAALAQHGLAYLLGDVRRFQIGNAHVSLEPGLSSTEIGLSSQELVEAIAPHLSRVDLELLRDRIECWSVYGRSFRPDDDPAIRHHRLQWADEHRIKLLERLPQQVLSSRRRRQIQEWRAAERRPAPRRRVGLTMATIVGSPMSHQTMAKARDEDIFAMLDEVNDQAGRHSRRRPIAMDGGVTELSRSFGVFAKEHPDRAIGLCLSKFVAGRHEHAAAEMLNELAKTDDVSPSRLLDLAHELSNRGFASETWKTCASWALAKLAGKLKGLPDRTITLLETWLENEPTKILQKVQQRLSAEAEDALRNAQGKSMAGPLIFGGRRTSGLRIVPHDNFPVLDAIFHGLIDRDDRGFNEWLSVLERHSDRVEDPHIWSFLLMRSCWALYRADRQRARRLLSKLWQADQRIFLDIDLGGTLWDARAMVPDELMIAIITAWSAKDDKEYRQAAAELAEAFRIVEPSSPVSQSLPNLLLDKPSPELTGRLFTCASAWHDGEGDVRKATHAVLMAFVARAKGDQAHAISSAVDRSGTLPPDGMTRELILQIAMNEEVLSHALNGRFADGLQSLLLYPGFDDAVMEVTQRAVELMTNEERQRSDIFVARDFVGVSIALQRNDGPMRAAAMDAYERLLDAGTYGAEEAARDATGR